MGMQAKSVTFSGAGGTHAAPLYMRWFAAYQKATGITVDYQPIGSLSGIRNLRDGKADFAITDEAVTREQARSLPDLFQLPINGLAVIIIYNTSGIGTGIQLSAETLADIFLGSITHWNDQRIQVDNPGRRLPRIVVRPVCNTRGPVDTYLLTRYLSTASPTFKASVGTGVSVKWPTGYRGSSEGIIDMVRWEPGTIGYMGYPYVLVNLRASAASVCALKNGIGQYVLPSVITTRAGLETMSFLETDTGSPDYAGSPPGTVLPKRTRAMAYPLVGYSYMLVPAGSLSVSTDDTKSAKRKALVDLMRWITETGQTVAPVEWHLTPLPASMIQRNKERLDRLTI